MVNFQGCANFVHARLLQKTLFTELAKISKMNFFPRRMKVSPSLSPHNCFTGPSLLLNSQFVLCCSVFGSNAILRQ